MELATKVISTLNTYFQNLNTFDIDQSQTVTYTACLAKYNKFAVEFFSPKTVLVNGKPQLQ
jgi:hypothetical protein